MSTSFKVTYTVQTTANLKQITIMQKARFLQTVGEGQRSKCQATIFNIKLIRNSSCSPLSFSSTEGTIAYFIKMLPKTLKKMSCFRKMQFKQPREFKILYKCVEVFIPKGFSSSINIGGHRKCIFYKESKLFNAFKKRSKIRPQHFYRSTQEIPTL